MDFQQEYIPHEYLELKIPAGTDNRNDPVFLLDPNHLHIWPRHSFMLIALPNKVSCLPQHNTFLSASCIVLHTGQVVYFHVIRSNNCVRELISR